MVTGRTCVGHLWLYVVSCHCKNAVRVYLVRGVGSIPARFSESDVESDNECDQVSDDKMWLDAAPREAKVERPVHWGARVNG